MTSYTTFDANVQCEEFYALNEQEYDAVLHQLAEEKAAEIAFYEYLDGLEETERAAYLEQAALEAMEAARKDWLKGYSPLAAGKQVAI